MTAPTISVKLESVGLVVDHVELPAAFPLYQKRVKGKPKGKAHVMMFPVEKMPGGHYRSALGAFGGGIAGTSTLIECLCGAMFSEVEFDDAYRWKDFVPEGEACRVCVVLARVALEPSQAHRLPVLRPFDHDDAVADLTL